MCATSQNRWHSDEDGMPEIVFELHMNFIHFVQSGIVNQAEFNMRSLKNYKLELRQGVLNKNLCVCQRENRNESFVT